MEEKVTETIKKSSSGSVKISLEEYKDLLDKAAEKAPVVYNTVQKTKAMVAEDNKVWGALIFSGGVCISVLGVAMHLLGRAQQNALDNEIHG